MDNAASLDQNDIKTLFIHHLNRINCAKQYLTKNLPSLMEVASFRNMKLAIRETHEDVVRQLKRIEEIYQLFGSHASDEGCEVIKAVIEKAYSLGNRAGKTRMMNDMDIILYMRIIENIELTSFKMLKLINQYLGNEEATQLLAECSDESNDNENLFAMISEEYLAQSA